MGPIPETLATKRNQYAPAFILLVGEFLRVCEFIELTDTHLDVYSHRLYEILLRACEDGTQLRPGLTEYSAFYNTRRTGWQIHLSHQEVCPKSRSQLYEPVRRVSANGDWALFWLAQEKAAATTVAGDARAVGEIPLRPLSLFQTPAVRAFSAPGLHRLPASEAHPALSA
jgi:hypothetical protein